MGPSMPVALATEVAGMPAATLARAREVYGVARARRLTATSVYTVIDYTLRSDTPRLWTFDVETGEVYFHLLVTHGQGSGGRMATAFSDTPNSHQSSLGLARAAERYVGKHGVSLRLDGLEPGINGNMRARAIVVHGADYATDAAVAANRRAGTPRLGRSHGCPAVAPEVIGPLIDRIEGGSLVFGHHTDAAYWAATTLTDRSRSPSR
jgi:hypothetical protein